MVIRRKMWARVEWLLALVLWCGVLWLNITPALADSRSDRRLDWRSHRSERFVVHFPVTREGPDDPFAVDGARVARRVSEQAEALLADYQKLFPVALKLPLHIVLDAQLDQESALARPEWGVIELSTTPGPFFPFRERGDWLRERLAHELAHLVLVSSISPLPPGTAAQLELDLSDRALLTRTLGANPPLNPTATLQARVPVADGTPYFFLEGGAEYLAGQIEANHWDASRDMLLRMSALEDLLLSPTALRSGLGKSGLDGERTYNQGHAFLLFLRERYGEESFLRIVQAAAKKPRFDWLDAFDDGQGISFTLLHARFREWLTNRYQPVSALKRDAYFGEELDLAVRPWRSADLDARRRWMALPVEVRKTEREGQGLLSSFPAWSPDGRMLAYWDDGLKVRAIPEEQWSAYGGRALDSFTDRLEVARRDRRMGSMPQVRRYPMSWSPDGKRLAVVADATWGSSPGHARAPKGWNAIYLMDARETPRGSVALSVSAPGTMVPNTLRGQDPAWSPDGRWLAFVRHADGTANLWVVRPDGTEPRALTRFNDGTDVANPSWSPDSRQLVFEMYRKNQRDLWVIDASTGGILPVMLDEATDLAPTWGRDGKIYFSSDSSGIFNLYSYDASTLEVRRLTDVLGGAFMPNLTPRGNLSYVYFDGYSLKLYGLRADRYQDTPVDNPSYIIDPSLAQAYLLGAQESPSMEGEPYRPWRGTARTLFTPTLVVTPFTVSAGASLTWRDPLSRHALRLEAFGGSGSYLEARYETSRIGERFSLGALQSNTRRGVALYSGDPEAPILTEHHREQRLRAAFVSLELPSRGRLRLALSGDARGLVFREREDASASRPLYLSLGGGPELELNTFASSGDQSAAGINPRRGALARLRYQLRESRVWDPVSGGALDLSGELADHYLFHRLDFELLTALALPWQQHTLEVRANFGYLNRDVAWWDELRAGGRVPALDAALDPFVAFPGYEATSLSGESLAVLALAYRFPVVDHLERAWGPLYVDAIYAQLGTTLGNTWGFVELAGEPTREAFLGGPSARNNPGNLSGALLSEVGLELRATSTLFQRYRWNSFMHLGYALDSVTGVGDVNRDDLYPGTYGDLLPEAGGELLPAGLRLHLGLGTGF